VYDYGGSRAYLEANNDRLK